MPNEKAWNNLWFSRTKRPVPPPCFEFITLITYQFFLLLFACLACLCACLCLRTLALTTTIARVLASSTYVIKSFWTFFRSFFTHPPIVFRFFTKVFFQFPPPCLVSHFSLFNLLFTLPDFLQPACFTCLFIFVSLCGLCSLRLYGWVGLKGRVCGSAHYNPSAPYPDAQNKQVFSTVLG